MTINISHTTGNKNRNCERVETHNKIKESLVSGAVTSTAVVLRTSIHW